jgi:uncharacterized membrane protein
MLYRRYCRLLILLGIILFALAAQAQRATLDFTAGRLYEVLGMKQGELVEDDAADGGRAFMVKGALNLERYGDFGQDAGEKLLRITLRAKTTRMPPAEGHLSLAAWSDVLWRTEAIVDAREFPRLDQYVTITRDMQMGKVGKFGLWARGGWPGLHIERLTYTVLDPPPVQLMRVWPKKLVYRLDETGVLEVTARNTTPTPQNVRLTLAIESGLADRSVLHDKDVSIAPGTHVFAVPLPPQSEYGHAVIAELRQGEQLLGRTTEYFFATNRPLHVGHYGGLGTGEGYGAESAAGAIMGHRRHYFPLLEVMFWAPCDMSQIAPPPGKERWWSGQTGKLGSTKKYLDYTRIAHENGMSVVAYVVYNNIFGWRIFDVGRSHPEWLDWYGIKPSYRVGDMALLRREDDIELEQRAEEVEPTSMCAFAISGNPQVLKLHGDQLAAGIKAFDWDGYRYDDWLSYDKPMTDLLGRRSPFNGWTNPMLFDYLRGRIREAKPGAVFGHNMHWNQEEKPDPLLNQPPLYTEAVRDGSMALQEAWSNRAFTHGARWDDWAKRTLRAGTNIYRYGGEQYVITDVANDSGTTSVDRNYLIALEMAGGCHVTYSVPEEQVPYMRLACRYSDLLFGDQRHFPDPDATLKVEDGGKLWWRDYVRYRMVAPGKRVYYVHLFNPPVTEKMGEQPKAPGAAVQTPDDEPDPDDGDAVVGEEPIVVDALRPPVQNVKLSWQLPAGWKAQAAYHITADARGEIQQRSEMHDRLYTHLEPTGLERQPLPLAGATVTIPLVRQWSLVAVECSGPTDAPETDERLPLPARQPLPDVNAPIVALRAPDPVKQAPKPFLMRMTAVKREGMTIVDEPEAMGGKALKLGPKGFNGVDTGFAPAPPAPGRYRLTLRVKTPALATSGVSGFLSSANNSGTPWAKAQRAEWKIPVAAFPEPGKWGEVTTEVVMTYPRYWGGFYGGWDGLLLDTFTLTPIEIFTDSQQLAWVVTPSWPNEPPTPEEPAVMPSAEPADAPEEPGEGEIEIPPAIEEYKGPRVWIGNGLYSDQYRLEAVFEKALGARITRADHVMAWGTPSWQHEQFPTTPGRLMRYGCVVLGNVPLNTLTVGQRAWLRGYVRDGGSLLLLGGPYGFGNGGWQDSDLLLDLLPITMGSYRDLSFVGEKAPVALEPVGPLAKGVSWTKKPVVFWQHLVTPRPGAVVQVNAGGNPLLVTGTYGKGRVAVITAAPLGDTPVGTLAFWDWSEWPKLMTGVGKWLLGQ